MSRTISVWEVSAGKFKRQYGSEHHAEQMARALRLNGMAVTVRQIKLRNDPLTRLVLA